MQRYWSCIMLCCLVWTGTAFAQSSKRVSTPTGYEEVYPGLGSGGRDSLFYRLTFARSTARDDTLMVVLKTGERRKVSLSYAHATVDLELLGFKRWLVVLEYPELVERLMPSGWNSWLQGKPTDHLRIPWKDVAHVYRLRPGLEIELFPKLPE